MDATVVMMHAMAISGYAMIGYSPKSEIADIRDCARTQVYNSLQNKDPFELLELGRQFHYREWVVHGYSLLARPGFMLSGNLLLANGLGDKMSDIFMIREAMRQAESRRPLTCMGCNTPPPPDPTAMGPMSGASSRQLATGGSSREDAAGIAYCKCRQVIFLRMNTGSFDWVSMSKRLVEWVFADELAELNSNKKSVAV
ncbi:hypothetical protein BJ165DRAFT_1410545 [Panaeolus papilionaceus]|nr:hypothetical protein BJ165DRAFT_1410545 [Panaeolus papilionaceus]